MMRSPVFSASRRPESSPASSPGRSPGRISAEAGVWQSSSSPWRFTSRSPSPSSDVDEEPTSPADQRSSTQPPARQSDGGAGVVTGDRGRAPTRSPLRLRRSRSRERGRSWSRSRRDRAYPQSKRRSRSRARSSSRYSGRSRSRSRGSRHSRSRSRDSHRFRSRSRGSRRSRSRSRQDRSRSYSRDDQEARHERGQRGEPPAGGRFDWFALVHGQREGPRDRFDRGRPQPTDALNSQVPRRPDWLMAANNVVGSDGKTKRDGRTKLFWNGYEYTRATITLKKILYRCSFFRRTKCPARLVFMAKEMEYDFANHVPHTCKQRVVVPPNATAASPSDIIRLVKKEIDEIAITQSLTPQQAWDNVSTKYLYSATVPIVGVTKAQVIKRFHNARSRHYGTSLHGQVETPPLSLVKGTQQWFFQFHYSWHNPPQARSRGNSSPIDRIVGWANPAMIPLLAYKGVNVFFDGTFRCVPTGFKQCMVLMVYDQGSKLYLPIFYVLATSKSFDAYWNVFQMIRSACGQAINPSRVACDFERALTNAVCDWYPEADVIGCYFHFKQACQRKMAKLRIPKPEISIAMSSGILDMLTVIDPSRIWRQGAVWVKNAIANRCESDNIHYSTRKWLSFWKYFERTWVKQIPPKFWNVWKHRDKAGRELVARTNNPLKRFNRTLNDDFSSPHPSLSRFIQTIESLAREHVKLRQDVTNGLAKPPQRTEVYGLPAPIELHEDAPTDFGDASESDSDSDSEGAYETDSSDAAAA